MAKQIVTDLITIFRSGVTAVLPENLIRRTVVYNPHSKLLTINSDVYDLQNKKFFLIGTGKAVQNMAIEIEKILMADIKESFISIPCGSLKQGSSNEIITFCQGAKNNLPDAEAEATARKIKNLTANLGEDDFLLVLISGGGSALLPLPKHPITLEEKTTLIKKLANCGADITELNTVRKRISDIKGGKLAIAAQPAQVVSLVLSDIVGDPVDLIASGPTTENFDHPSKSKDIIDKYKLYSKLPESIKTVLENSMEETKFPRDRVRNYIIGSNKLSIAESAKTAKKLNYFTLDLSNIVTGNVIEIAKKYANLVRALCEFMLQKCDPIHLKSVLSSLKIPGLDIKVFDKLLVPMESDLCLILGGEITVEVKGKGKGGRNQQLALEFSNFVHKMKSQLIDFDVYLLSAGTDGIDGPTDAAGAIGYKDLVTDSELENINVNMYLENNDSYNFYKRFRNGDLHVITGHTDTNVMDLHIIVIKHTDK